MWPIRRSVCLAAPLLQGPRSSLSQLAACVCDRTPRALGSLFQPPGHGLSAPALRLMLPPGARPCTRWMSSPCGSHCSGSGVSFRGERPSETRARATRSLTCPEASWPRASYCRDGEMCQWVCVQVCVHLSVYRCVHMLCTGVCTHVHVGVHACVGA